MLVMVISLIFYFRYVEYSILYKKIENESMKSVVDETGLGFKNNGIEGKTR